jgi:phenylalanyl-tRNA synthetase alpha chain
VQRRAVVTVAKPDELKGAKTDEQYNIPASVTEKLGSDLLLKEKHPIGVLWKEMQTYFKSVDSDMVFYDREDPIVNTVENFDNLRLPPGHPGRSPSDTYYVNKDTVLRTHTSAHQCKHMAEYPKVTSFLCAGDVYRRDEIDASHYPVFHQCEGVRLFDAEKVSEEEIKADLKKVLEGLVAHLFAIKNDGKSMQWRDDYFPFTEPSFEMDVFYEDDWLEVLGCGVIHEEVLQNAGLDPKKVQGWAFGIGLERIAMILFGINDIRLFWSDDERFSKQFDENAFADKVKFKPFSKYPPVKKDISMWIPEDFVDNDLFEMIRDEGGDQVEKVELIDEFTNKKTGKRSKAFRVIWRDMSRTLTNEEVNAKHEIVLEKIVKELSVELR